MTFEIDLEAARALATEYTGLLHEIRGMSVAEDHNPLWSEGDAAKLDESLRRHGAVGRQLSGELARLAADHHDAWRAFLSTALERLRLLSQHDGPGLDVSYEHDQWAKWLEGDVPDDPAEIFARGIRVLADHDDVVD